MTVTVLPSRVKSASVDGDELSVTFDTTLDATSKPAGSAFTVTASKAGSSRSIAGTAASVAISGRTVTATLSAAVAAGERLTVRYDKPASGAVLKESGGNALASFPDRPAGNVGGDTTGPAFVSAQANGATVISPSTRRWTRRCRRLRGSFSGRSATAPLPCRARFRSPGGR